MASLPTVFLLLLPMCLSVSLIPFPASAQDSTIQDTCSKTMFPMICEESLSVAAEGSTVTMTDMARVSLNLASMAANETSFYTSGLLQISQQPAFQQCVSHCSETYMDAAVQLGNAAVALATKNYVQVYNWVSAAMSDAASCMDGCKGVAGLTTRLVEKDDYFNKLCTNTLAIAKLLQQ